MDEHLLTQALFRDLLRVMSRPGTVKSLSPRISSISPEPLVAIAATLLDQETTYAVLDDEQLDRAVRLKTEARTAPLEDADFIFVPGGASGGRIGRAQRGTLAYPDTGATLLYRVESLAEDSSTPTVELSGPGIAEQAKPCIEGIDVDDLVLLNSINEQYPLGIDLILVDTRQQVMALPRSTQIKVCGI
jgi:alpha-D-ribose 1-methylphosphonate 5-triphosphate synthase subunit PhnH